MLLPNLARALAKGTVMSCFFFVLSKKCVFFTTENCSWSFQNCLLLVQVKSCKRNQEQLLQKNCSWFHGMTLFQGLLVVLVVPPPLFPKVMWKSSIQAWCCVDTCQLTFCSCWHLPFAGMHCRSTVDLWKIFITAPSKISIDVTANQIGIAKTQSVFDILIRNLFIILCEDTIIMTGYLIHLCYKTDFLFAKSQDSQSYFRYTFLNTQWTFCESMRKKLRCIFYLFAFLENACFVCNSMGNGPVEGTITSILKHLKVYYSKTHLNFFFWFLQKMSRYYPWT